MPVRVRMSNVTKINTFPGMTSNPGEMPMYWNITNDCTTEYSMDLTLCYTDDELARGNSITEASLGFVQEHQRCNLDEPGRHSGHRCELRHLERRNFPQ